MHVRCLPAAACSNPPASQDRRKAPPPPQLALSAPGPAPARPSCPPAAGCGSPQTGVPLQPLSGHSLVSQPWPPALRLLALHRRAEYPASPAWDCALSRPLLQAGPGPDAAVCTQTAILQIGASHCRLFLQLLRPVYSPLLCCFISALLTSSVLPSATAPLMHLSRCASVVRTPLLTRQGGESKSGAGAWSWPCSGSLLRAA
ncbi:hypothetical protein ABPG77_010018 [Micractinium sp. CCAP 211/92]